MSVCVRVFVCVCLRVCVCVCIHIHILQPRRPGGDVSSAGSWDHRSWPAHIYHSSAQTLSQCRFAYLIKGALCRYTTDDPHYIMITAGLNSEPCRTLYSDSAHSSLMDTWIHVGSKSAFYQVTFCHCCFYFYSVRDTDRKCNTKVLVLNCRFSPEDVK